MLTVGFLLRWVEKRQQLGINGRARLFCTLQGRPLYPSYVRTMLARVADRARIEKRVHPHGLRHSMAFELMWEGTPVPIIQAALGHASLGTTQRYLDHLAHGMSWRRCRSASGLSDRQLPALTTAARVPKRMGTAGP